MMMNMEILEEFSGSNDQVIVKGKRTKRSRQLYSTTSSCAGGDGGGEEIWSSMVSSPTTDDSSEISTSTEEDEDMANCLILLARGGFPPKEMKSPEKISSRKFTEMATATTNGKVGIYVYQCKTCNRTFPSFQALGGHRASHKKPKPTAENDRTKSPPADEDQEGEYEEDEGKFSRLINYNTPPPSTQLINKSFHLENKPKIHECSICGSEFASGQALGGHMRRHRSAANTTGKMISSSNNIDSSNFNETSSSHEVGTEKPRNMLALDLNLPAPPEEDHRETKLNLFSSNQQPRLVFSAAALVDCHY